MAFPFKIFLFESPHLFLIAVNTSLKSTLDGFLDINTYFLIKLVPQKYQHFLITCDTFQEFIDSSGEHARDCLNYIIKFHP